MAPAPRDSSTPPSQLQRVRDDVREATVTAKGSIDKLITRGETLELLVDKSETFGDQAKAFKKSSKTLQSKLWWDNARMVGKVGALVLALLLVYAFLHCGWRLCVQR